MAPHARNPPMIVVTSEVNSPDNTAHIGRFGARSRPDSSLEPEISDVHQVEGPFQSYSSDAPFHFSSSDDNSFNGTAFQASSQRSFPLYSSPESNFSDVDESPSSTLNYVASPFLFPSSHSNDLKITSPGSSLNDGFIQMTLNDTASPVSQSLDGIGHLPHSRRYSDGGGFPTYHGLRRPQLDQLHSPLTVELPNVGSNNGLGLTLGNGHPPAREMFFVGQRQTASYPHAPLSPIIPFSPNRHTLPSHALLPLDLDISNELSAGSAFVAGDHPEDWTHSLSLSSFGPSTQGMDASDEPPPAPESYTGNGVHFPSPLGCGFPSLGVDVDRGVSGGPHSAPASYGEYGAHLPSHFSFDPSTQRMDASDEPSGGAYSAPESYTIDRVHFLPHRGGGFPPPGVDVDRGLSDSAQARYSEDGADHGPLGGPQSAPERYSEGGVHFPSRPGSCFPPPGVDVDRRLSCGPYSAPASYSEYGAHFSSHFNFGSSTQGMGASDEPPGGAYSAPGRYIEEGSSFAPRSSRALPSRVVDDGHGLFDAPGSASASSTEDVTHLAWRSSCSLPPTGMDASNGPYSSPARYVPLNISPSDTSSRSPFRSFFEDERRDPMHDTPAAASSSAVSGWPGDTTELSLSHKKAVSSEKIRIASEKRRKKSGRFICSLCGNTFTEKHNLINHTNSHRGLKPHPCERCPSAFGVISSLKRHRKVCNQTKLT